MPYISRKIAGRLSWRRPGLVTGFGLAALLLSCLVIGAVLLHQARVQAQVVARELYQARTALSQAPADPLPALERASSHLRTARAALETFRPLIEAAGTVAPIGGGVPLVRQGVAWWTFADAVEATGRELTEAARLAVTSLQASPSLAGLVPLAPAVAAHLQAAEAHYRRAEQVRPGLQPNWLPGDLASQAEQTLASWDALAPRLAELLPPSSRLLAALPAAVGSERPVTYLVIIQSSDNLRATGGFLTGVGTVRLEAGRVTAVTMTDVTEAELPARWTPEQGYLAPRIPPPDPLRRYMGLGHWVLRDGNWWADFPTTARQVTQFWQLVDPTPLDGVVALTDQAVDALLAAVGPLTISGGQSLESANWKTIAGKRIHRQAAASAGNPQSAFFQETLTALLAQTARLSPEDWLPLARQGMVALARHDILAASFDPRLAETLHALGVDGALRGQQDDYVYLVEDNLADSKLSSLIRQQLLYEVRLAADGRPILAALTVDKANTYTPGTRVAGFSGPVDYSGGRWDGQTGRWDRWEGYYGGYLRLFPASGSQVTAVTGFDDKIDVGTENGRTVVGGYVGMWLGSQRRLQFRWSPGDQPSAPGQYRLLVQRQPGAPAYPLTVRVQLPTGYRATTITPDPLNVADSIVTWQSTLDQDRVFLLHFQPVSTN